MFCLIYFSKQIEAAGGLENFPILTGKQLRWKKDFNTDIFL